VVATAASYVVSPAALGDAASDPAHASDRLSARYLIALAARVVREVGELLRGSKEHGKHLVTLALDTEIRFRSPADRSDSRSCRISFRSSPRRAWNTAAAVACAPRIPSGGCA
jgi:hypothetical protein